MRALFMIASLVVVGVVGPSSALAETQVPPFPPDRVATAGVREELPTLRKFLAGYESASGAGYHVCVVEFSDPRNRFGCSAGGSSW